MSVAIAGESRRWTPIGKDPVEATLHAVKGGQIKLLPKEIGAPIILEASQLSKADRAYVREWLSRDKVVNQAILSKKEVENAWYAEHRAANRKFLFEANLKSRERVRFEFSVPAGNGQVEIFLAFEKEDQLIEYARKTRRGIQEFGKFSDGWFVAHSMLTGMSSSTPGRVENGMLKLELENLTPTSSKIAVWIVDK